MEATTKIRKYSLRGNFGRTLLQSSTNRSNSWKGPVKDNISSEVGTLPVSLKISTPTGISQGDYER